MGAYIRADSPFYWLLLEGTPSHRRPTKIRHTTPSPQQTKENKRLAQLAYHKAMAALTKRSLDLPDAQTKTFADFAAWYRLHKIPKRRGKDREHYLLTHLERYFRTTPLRLITKARVDEYETHRLESVGPSTINREVDLLKTMLRIAAENGDAPAGLLVGKKRLHVPKRAKARLTPAQETALLDAIESPNDRAIIIMGLDTLARRGDLLDFQRAHDHGTTADIIDPKNGDILSVPISPRLRAALDACEPDPKQSGYYFWNRRVAKNPRDWGGSVRLMLKRACRLAGVPYGRNLQAITFHSATRRTGASRMLARGASMKTVQSIGGWKDLRSIQGYLMAEDDDRQSAVKLVSARTPASRREKLKREVSK
jgi:hypothetical protein